MTEELQEKKEDFRISPRNYFWARCKWQYEPAIEGENFPNCPGRKNRWKGSRMQWTWNIWCTVRIWFTFSFRCAKNERVWVGCTEGWREAIEPAWKADKKANTGLSCGSVVKNLLANAGDTVSIPDLGRLHMLWKAKLVHHSYWACALEPGSCNYWAQVLQLWKSCMP